MTALPGSYQMRICRCLVLQCRGEHLTFEAEGETGSDGEQQVGYEQHVGSTVS